MNVPAELKYSKSHEWVQFTGEDTAKVGITDFAQYSLGSIVFVTLPEEGDSVTAGESMGEVESVKAVSDVLCPVSGTVKAINDVLLDNPADVNIDPYAAWFVEVEGITEKEDLMTAEEYHKHCTAKG